MLTYSSTKLCIKSLRTLVTPSVATEKLTTASTHWVNLTRAHFTMKRHHKTWWNSKLDCFEKLLAMNKFLSWFVDILRKWFRAKMTQCVNGRWTVQPMDRSIQINEETLVSCSLNWDYFHPHDEFACLRISSKSIISRYENNQVLRAALADCFSFSRQSSFMCNFSTANWRKWNLVIHQLVRTKNETIGPRERLNTRQESVPKKTLAQIHKQDARERCNFEWNAKIYWGNEKSRKRGTGRNYDWKSAISTTKITPEKWNAIN